MAYAIAGIDVHKRMLAVVVSDLAADGEDAFERRQFGFAHGSISSADSGRAWSKDLPRRSGVASPTAIGRESYRAGTPTWPRPGPS
jgi:hypothetical protein